MEDLELIEKRITFYTEQIKLIEILIAAIDKKPLTPETEVECARLQIEKSKLQFEVSAKGIYIAEFYNGIEKSKALADNNAGYMTANIESLIKSSEELVKNTAVPQEHRDRMKGLQLQYHSIWKTADNFTRSQIFFPLKKEVETCLNSLQKS